MMQDHSQIGTLPGLAATIMFVMTVAAEAAKLINPVLTALVLLLTAAWWWLRLREMMAARRTRIGRERLRKADHDQD